MPAVEVRSDRRRRLALVVAVVIAMLGLSPVAQAAPRATVSVVVPIVASGTDSGFLDATQLESATSSMGRWTILTNAALSAGATIALDSRIVASIVQLGDAAPVSAHNWLASVEQSRPLYLPWGNADPFLLGSTVVGNRISAIQLADLSGIAANDLVGWPTGHAGGARSISRAESLGFTRLIVDDVTAPDAVGTYSRAASDRVAALVAPSSTLDIDSAVAELVDEGLPVAIALPRNPTQLDPNRVANFLRALRSNSVRVASFDPLATTSLATAVIANPPLDAIRALLNQRRLDLTVSHIGVEPSAIALPRLAHLCVLAGFVGDKGFATLVRDYLRDASTYEDVVTFQTGSNFTLLANEADVPFTVSNLSDTDVTVTVSVRSQTGILHVSKQRHEITVTARSTAQVSVPVRTVANGRTSLIATLETAGGVVISHPVAVTVDVQAQWEGVTLIGFVSLVALIMGVGIARQIRDRRTRV